MRGLLALGVSVLAAALPAGAATPEPSGLIAFTRIGYAVGSDGPVSSAIYTVDLQSRRVRRLTNPPSGAFDSEPAWSPDGRRIAYARARFAGFGAGRVEILVADMRGRVLRHVRSIGLSSPPRGWAGPAWSPDGSRMAFSNGSVVAALGLGGEPGSLFAIGMFGGIEWSPDGREIAATGWSRASQSSSLQILGPGEEPRVIRSAWGGLDWTPRGILFTSDGTLAIVSADGSGFRSLGLPGLNPSWSPGGRWIAYERHASLGRRPIMVASVTGSAPRQVTRPPRNFADVEPDWRPHP